MMRHVLRSIYYVSYVSTCPVPKTGEIRVFYSPSLVGIGCLPLSTIFVSCLFTSLSLPYLIKVETPVLLNYLLHSKLFFEVKVSVFTIPTTDGLSDTIDPVDGT